MPLSPDQVRIIRVSGLTDAHLGRLYRVLPETIRRARVGITHPDHPTPPDTTPRESAGRKAGSESIPARARRSCFV